MLVKMLIQRSSCHQKLCWSGSSKQHNHAFKILVFELRIVRPVGVSSHHTGTASAHWRASCILASRANAASRGSFGGVAAFRLFKECILDIQEMASQCCP